MSAEQRVPKDHPRPENSKITFSGANARTMSLYVRARNSRTPAVEIAAGLCRSGQSQRGDAESRAAPATQFVGAVRSIAWPGKCHAASLVAAGMHTLRRLRM